MEKQNLSIQIRFPYCPGHCVFCEEKTYGENITAATRYRRALEKEIAAASEELNDYTITSVRLGGGALGTLGYGSLENFIDILQHSIPSGPETVWIAELLPSEISDMNLAILKQHRVRHISLGIMGMTKEELRALHRPYSINLVEHSLQLLPQTEMKVSAALVIGIPGQTPEQLSAHTERLARAGFQEVRLLRFHDKTISPARQREYAEETDWRGFIGAAERTLSAAGYERRGSSLVFALPGPDFFPEDSLPDTGAVMGFGVGAVTRLDGLSYRNTERMEIYLDHSDSFEDIAIVDR